MSFSYVVREGFAGFKRARLSAFSSVTAMLLAVVLLGVLIRVSTNAYELAQAIKQDVEIEVFLLDIGEQRTNQLRAELESSDVVSEVSYISKTQAMERFRAEFGAEAEFLGDVQFLPASFLVRATPEAQASAIVSFVDQIQTLRGVDDVRFNQRGLELLEERLHLFVIGGTILGIFIGLTALVLVFNTIRLTIYAKKDLIKAMKLVGATNGFIKRPFMFEGTIQGLMAGFLGVGLVWLIFQLIVPAYIPQVGVMSWPFGRWYYLCGLLIFFALFLGFFGSRWAAHKFIKETTISG
ncbi:MAG: permease-like cell division protein FtsX [Balneolales bacterium]|nr:permease-like cell division protein FtsX [Balneolales bacterium]